MRTNGVVLRRPKVLICLFACVSVAAFLVPVDVISAHEGDEGSVVIHMTDKGFEPQSVEIQSGDTVVFENAGDEAHWPASDDHPTHEEYSEFDPKKPIQPDMEWSFTFDRPGNWEYHDHMNPYLMGKVVVVENASGHESFISSLKAFLTNAYERTISALVGEREEEYASAGKARAEGSPDGSSEGLADERYEERKDEFLALVRDENPRAALDRMREEIETDDALSRSCHALVHEIGRAAYEKYGDFGEAMKYRDELCNSGYLHGIIESHFSQSEDVFAEMKTMCNRYKQGSYISWQCYHGLGHGVMFYTANDLPRSLEMCEGFKSDFGRSSCVNGVFMENFNTEQKLHVSKFLKEDDPFYPCPEQPERYKSDCYLYAPTYFLNLNNDDYAGALVWCKGAEDGYESMCARGVGGGTMKENMNDPKFVEATCMSGGPQQVAPCVEGMVGLYINHNGSLEPARELCAELEVSNRRTCYGTVETYAGLFRS